MSDQKSDKTANELRDKANKQFCQKLYSDALINFNKSLFSAETKNSKSSVFVNRSAVYFELKLYDKCLENIKIALKYELHENLVNELNKRQEKCLKIMNQQAPPEEFFKLSHPAKRKIPFIIDGLDIFKTESQGRGIYAIKDLKAGDCIALEEPYWKFLKEDAKFERCAKCLSSNKFNLVCSIKSDMFCSESCMYKAVFNNFGDFFDFGISSRISKVAKNLLLEVGGIENLYKMIKESSPDSTIFSYNLRNPNDPETKKNLMKCFLSLSADREGVVDVTQMLDGVENIAKNYREIFDGVENSEKDYKEIKMLEKIFVHLGFLDQLNLLEFKQDVASGILLFGSLINHSCESNVHPVLVDNKIAWICTSPIEADDQIFRNYGTSLDQSNKEKQEFLLQKYGFKCKCGYCTGEKKTQLEMKDPKFKEPAKKISTVENANTELKSNWEFINKKKNKKLSYEINKLTTRNLILLDFISNPPLQS